VTTRDLIPNGRDIPVTFENRKEYILKLCEFYLKTSIKKNLFSLVRGFHRVIRTDTINMLTPKQLEYLLCGQN